MIMEGTWVLKGHGYGGDMCMEGTMVWRGHGYGEDKGMERDKGMEGI